MDSIFIVFGNNVNSDFSNVKSLTTRIIPNKDEKFVFDRKKYLVIDKIIDYTQVEHYNNIDDPERGQEIIYIFVERI